MVPIKILHITPFFSPNIGGVETHLTDLTSKLSALGYQNYVLTYSPLTTENVSWKPEEQINKNLYVRRFRWFGHNLFHRLETKPFINFFYLTPCLSIRSTFWQLKHHQKFDVIHSHGLNAAIIGIIFQKIFHIHRHIVSIYSTYDHVPKSNFFIAAILNHVDVVLTQSNRSITQLISLGVNKHKIHRYRHWINLDQFKPQHLTKKRTTILFIGRMIPQKNALLLAKTAKYFPKINFLFVGEGPDHSQLKKLAVQNSNIILYGNVPYDQLQNYYNLADVFCLPSKYDEGWGRVLMESIACGVPVLATNMGAVPEVIDSSVGVLFTPTSNNLHYQLSHLSKIIPLKKNCRTYALKHFSDKNISLITRFYIKT
jgi:glycosyltransferase involved in cell wall biosynthesis